MKPSPLPLWRRVIRWTTRTVILLVLLGALAFGFLFRHALYNRYVDFPREAAAWEAIREKHEEPTLAHAYKDYRGVLHSHSHFSHDCDVPFEEILAALKKTDRDFIMMSDHCHEGAADFGVQWSGLHDGVLFVPGYEMKHGFMPWGLPRGTVLDCGKEPALLSAEIEALGGLLFFAHTEEPRQWDLPELDGMEIYNIHTDFKDESFAALIPDILLNVHRFPDQTMRLIFDRQDAILARWDELSLTRDITGIGANDCHQNNGVVITYTQDGKLRIADTSPEVKTEIALNPVTRLLARIAFGKLEPGRTLLHIQPDPYETMVNFVATHLLATELSEAALLDALDDGRVYVAFDAIADSTGFVFMAESESGSAVMGEELPHAEGVWLKGAAPLPARFRVIHQGEVAYETEGRNFAWQPESPGKYRCEVELQIRGAWTPWIYSNPLTLTGAEV